MENFKKSFKKCDKNIENSRQNLNKPKIKKISFWDIDGPIRNINTGEVSEVVISDIVEKLASGFPQILNTGRDYNFVVEEILPVILRQLKTLNLKSDNTKKFSENQAQCRVLSQDLPFEKILKNLVICAEYGTIYGVYAGDGIFEKYRNENLSIGEETKEKIVEIFNNWLEQNPENAKILYLSKAKEGCVTLEKWDNYPSHQFVDNENTSVKELLENLRKLLKNTPFNVIHANSAIDIVHKDAGKASGVVQGMKILRDGVPDGILPFSKTQIFAYGDSSTDYEMMQGIEQDPQLQKYAQNAKFIYVGEKDLKNDDVRIIRPTQSFTDGVEEFIKK